MTAQHADGTFSQAVIGHNAEKCAVHAKICQRQRNIGLAAAIACLKIGRHTDFFIIRRCQTQHDLTDCKKFLWAVIMFQ